MATCWEIFRFSWPLRGRGGGGSTQAVSLTAFSQFFFWTLPLPGLKIMPILSHKLLWFTAFCMSSEKSLNQHQGMVDKCLCGSQRILKAWKTLLQLSTIITAIHRCLAGKLASKPSEANLERNVGASGSWESSRSDFREYRSSLSCDHLCSFFQLSCVLKNVNLISFIFVFQQNISVDLEINFAF